MIRKLNIIIFVLFCHINMLHAQRISKTISSTYIFVSSFTKCGIDSWSAGGSTVSALGSSTAAFNNPAGMQFEKKTIYTEFGKWSISDWIADFKVNGQYITPSFVSVGLPIKRYMISIGYLNYYDLRLKSSMEITTLENPEGTGEFIETRRNIRLNTYFGSIKYSPNDLISIGLTFGLNYLSHTDKLYHIEACGQGSGYTFITGVIIKPIDNLTFGYNFKYLSDVKYDVKIESDPKLLTQPDVDPSVNGNNQNIGTSLQPNTYPYIGKFPYVFETGLSYQLISNLILYAGVELQKWRYIYTESEDIVNYHLGSSFSFTEPMIFYLGFFTQYNPGENYFSNNMNQHFLTFGFRVDISKSLSISASILDSHILKQKDQNKKYLQSYYSAGLSIKI